jgi:exosortase/archaeosortase family protein
LNQNTFGLDRGQWTFLFRSVLFIALYISIQYSPLFDLSNAKLTELISHSSRWILNNVYQENKIIDFWNGRRWVVSNGHSSLHIGSICNGYGLIFLYVGFISSTVGVPLLRKLFFAVIGSISIFIFNVIRIILLFVMKNQLPGLFDLFHHYIFQVAVYVLIFTLWYYYLKVDTNSSPSES